MDPMALLITTTRKPAEISFERPDYAYDVRGPSLPFFHNTFPSSITGLPDQKVENVILENILTLGYFECN